LCGEFGYTAATDELKQNLGLEKRTALFSRPAYRAITGIMTNILNPEVAAAMRISMPEYLKQANALTDKYLFALMTGNSTTQRHMTTLTRRAWRNAIPAISSPSSRRPDQFR